MTRDTHRSRARYARVLTRAAAFVRAVDTGAWGGWYLADVVRNNVPPVLWALIADMPHERAVMLRGELVSYRAFDHWKREHPRAIRAAIIQAWPHAYGRTLRDEMYRLEMERHWAQAERGPATVERVVEIEAVPVLGPGVYSVATRTDECCDQMTMRRVVYVEIDFSKVP